MLKNTRALTVGLVMLVACSAHAVVTETGDVIGNSLTFWLIGDTGTGSVAIDEGTAQDAVYVKIGNENGSDGTLNVTGGGSILHNTNILAVGDEAGSQGTINVTGGGLIESSELTIIGNYGKGTVNLSGAGSKMIAGNKLSPTRNTIVGYHGNSEGTVNINLGTSFEASRYAYGGYDGDSQGTYNVLGGSLTTARHLILGYRDNSSGTLNVDHGVVDIGVDGYDLYMGYDNQAEGTANISSGSTVRIHDDLYMGYAPSSGSTNNNKATMNLTGAGTTVSVADCVRLGYGWDAPTETLLSVGRGATMDALGVGGFITAYDTLDTATVQFIIGDDGTDTVASGRINAGSFGVGDGTGLFDLELDPLTSLSTGDMFTLIDYGTWDGNLFSNIADNSLFSAGGYQFLIDYDYDLGGGDYALTATVVVPEPSSIIAIWSLLVGGIGLVAVKRQRRKRD